MAFTGLYVRDVIAGRAVSNTDRFEGPNRQPVADAWADARANAVAALVAYDGVDPATIPAECPWTVAEVMEGDG